MTFLHAGLAIAGAALVAVPILIHILFRQRRRPVQWGAMRFVIEAYQKARSRMRFEQWLLLALRCLIIGLLGAALARPILKNMPVQALQGSATIYILLDNGLTSTLSTTPPAASAPVSALDRHRSMAREILSVLSPADRVGLITLASPVDPPVVPASIDHAAVLRALEAVNGSDAPADLPAALARLAEVLPLESGDSGPVLVYLLSELRAGSVAVDLPLSANLSGATRRPLTLLALPPAADAVANVQITSVEPTRTLAIAEGAAGLGNRVTIRLRRTGDASAPAATTVRLSTTPQTRAPEAVTIRWSPGQTEATSVLAISLDSPKSGTLVLQVRIDSDSLEADNNRSALVETRSAIRVGMIDRREFGLPGAVDAYSPAAWIRRALNPTDEDSGIDVEDVDPAALDENTIRGMDALVLTRPDLLVESGWSALRRHIERGGLLWITPSQSDGVALWPDLAAQTLRLPWRWSREPVRAPSDSSGFALASQQPDSELLRLIGAELPALIRPIRILRTLPVLDGLDPSVRVLDLDDGSPWLTAGNGADASGLVLYLASATSLDWTSLPTKPLMVALTQEIVRQGAGLSRRNLELRPGHQPALALGPASAELRAPDGSSIALRSERGFMRPARAIPSAGVYTAMDARGQALTTFVSNIDPQAGRTDVLSGAVLLDWLAGSGDWQWIDTAQPIASLLMAGDASADISLALFLALLVLTLLETLLARWFSHARRTDIDPTQRAQGLFSTLAPLAEPVTSIGRRESGTSAGPPQEAA